MGKRDYYEVLGVVERGHKRGDKESIQKTGFKVSSGQESRATRRQKKISRKLQKHTKF